MGTWLEDLVAASHERVDDRVREALWARGASDEQIETFQIGYIDQELPPAEYPASFLAWSGEGKKLVDAYVFPLTNPLGEIRGLQLRSVERDRRDYMDFFVDRSEPVFFGLGQAAPFIWNSEEIVLVEGVFDYFPVHRVRKDSIPTLTAKVSEPLLRFLKRLVRRVWTFYDADQIGLSASSNFAKEHGADFEAVRPIEYPRGVTRFDGKLVKDPGELWEAWGDDRFNPYLQTQME